MSLFAELKRRNVIRVAFAYLITAWLVLQVSQLVLETIEAPVWVLKALLLLFTLGLPLTLLFSWAYELTPEGVKREKDVDRSTSVTQDTAQKLDKITIAIAVALVVFIAVDRAYLSPSTQSTTATNSRPAVIAEKSIAVLAFEDLSPEGDQEYFADGLSDELLNVLAQIPDLLVAGRTSSFAFKGQNRNLREIGEILNVAHILEGSVRKSGNRIRVTAQLIDAKTGFHLYSKSYDRDLTDVFAVQDEIAAEISAALRTELIGTVAKETSQTSIAAYDLYLVARQKIYSRDKEQMTEASRLLDQALEIDSEYAPALTQKALVTILLSDNVGSYGDIPSAEAVAIARPLVDKALALDSRLAEAYAISGLVMGVEENVGSDEKIAILEHALTLNPNLDNARNWLATEYRLAGRFDESIALYESVVERDPLFGPTFNNLIQEYLRNRDFDRANALIGRVERIVGETVDVRQSWGMVAVVEGEPARAVRHLRYVYDANPSNTVVKIWYGAALYQIGELETIVEIGLPPQKFEALGMLGRHAEALALLPQLSPTISNNIVLRAVAYYYVNARNYDAVVAYVEQHFGSLDAALDHFAAPAGGNSHFMAPLAFSYLQLGREQEFLQLTAAIRDALSQQQASGLNNFSTWLLASQLAAITGEDDAALEYMQKIVDNNGVDVFAVDSPIVERLRENPRYQALKATMLKRANSERAKLGLKPYLHIAATN